MPIITTDIIYRLSGGSSNSDPNASIGGTKSSVAAGSNIFDDVPSAESVPGDIEYRCMYVHNAHATLALQNAVAWLAANTASGDTTVELALGNAALNATETAVADEGTAPSPGLTFAPCATQGAGISLGSIPAGQHRAIWLRRTVNAAAAASNDTFTLRVAGDTAA